MITNDCSYATFSGTMSVPAITYTIPLSKVDTTYTTTLSAPTVCGGSITYSLLDSSNNDIGTGLLSLDSVNKIISTETTSSSTITEGTYTYKLQA